MSQKLEARAGDAWMTGLLGEERRKLGGTGVSRSAHDVRSIKEPRTSKDLISVWFVVER